MISVPEKIRYHRGELGWALPREDGTYSIDNLPFDGGLVNFRDIVECREPTDPTRLPFVAKIVQRTFHAWSVVKYLPPSQDVYTALRHAVKAAGGFTEGAFPGTLVVASNVEDTTELQRILAKASMSSAVALQIVDHRVLPPAPVDLADLDLDYGAPAPTAGKPGPAIVPR